MYVCMCIPHSPLEIGVQFVRSWLSPQPYEHRNLSISSRLSIFGVQVSNYSLMLLWVSLDLLQWPLLITNGLRSGPLSLWASLGRAFAYL